MDTKSLSPMEVVNLNLAELWDMSPTVQAPTATYGFWTGIVGATVLMLYALLLSHAL